MSFLVRNLTWNSKEPLFCRCVDHLASWPFPSLCSGITHRNPSTKSTQHEHHQKRPWVKKKTFRDSRFSSFFFLSNLGYPFSTHRQAGSALPFSVKQSKSFLDLRVSGVERKRSPRQKLVNTLKIHSIYLSGRPSFSSFPQPTPRFFTGARPRPKWDRRPPPLSAHRRRSWIGKAVFFGGGGEYFCFPVFLLHFWVNSM